MNIFSTGDFSLFFLKSVQESLIFPFVWSPTYANGFGQNISFILVFNTFFNILSKFLVQFLNLRWEIAEKVFFIPVFFILSFLASYLFSKLFFKDRILRVISGIIYSTNTYALMLVSGGQFGVYFAYAFSPIVLWAFFREKINPITSGLAFGFLLLLDPRIAGILLFIILIFNIYQILFEKIAIKTLKPIFVSLLIGILLNAFWILPFLIYREITLNSAYTNTGIISFLSVAKLEDTMSLLHPNWPENIFGKVYFMRPEFLLIPILAFISLFLLKSKATIEQLSNRTIVFLSLLALLGIFLAKGVNPPMGFIYQWFADHIPGFIIYRDPLKFYLLIATGFSLLIPFSIKLLSNKFPIKILCLLFFVLWFLLIRQLFILGPNGVFKPRVVNPDYFSLNKLLSNDEQFYRTLWVPQVSRFGYISNTHPAIPGNNYFAKYDLEKLLANFKDKNIPDFLSNRSIKYIIVPADDYGEIFQKDWKYDNAKYQKAVSVISKLPYVQEVSGFNKLKIYRINNKERFWTGSKITNLYFKYLNPTKYEIRVNSARKGEILVFSESYSPNWTLIYKDQKIKSKPYDKDLNSFILPENGNYTFEIYFTPQKVMDFGFIISFIALLGSLAILGKNIKLNKNL